MQQKSIYSVREATRMAFSNMPEVFSVLSLVNQAKMIMGRPYCMDGTILRRLRELRDEEPGVFNYQVIDSETGKYQKKTVKNGEAVIC